MVCLQYKFIFVHITKCAGTFISQSLYSDYCILNERTRSSNLRFGYPLNHLKLNDIKNSKILHPNYEKFFKFTFVRNPFDRLVSEYFWLKKRINLSNDIKSELIKLSDYAKKGIYGNHCLLQSEFCKPEELDFIGRLENINEDFFRLTKLLKKEDINTFKNQRFHKTKHQHYTEYYDDETREIVAEKYAKDIEYFGYEFGD